MNLFEEHGYSESVEIKQPMLYGPTSPRSLPNVSAKGTQVRLWHFGDLNAARFIVWFQAPFRTSTHGPLLSPADPNWTLVGLPKNNPRSARHHGNRPPSRWNCQPAALTVCFSSSRTCP